jgi:predicted anti-sigma-YlaC factor YlaD
LIRSITCREFVEFLADYLDGEMHEAQVAEFDTHLSHCPSCVSYMNSYRDAIRLGRTVLRDADEPLPGDVPEELVRAILAARQKGS